MELRLNFRGTGIPKLNRAMDELGKETTRHKAYRRGLNHTGGKTFTLVRRALARQAGLSQKKVMDLGLAKPIRASFSDLSFRIKATGGHISLKEFSAKQFSYGVKAKPWGRVQRFNSAFIWAGQNNSSKFVGNGHVFKRSSSKSLPIAPLFGPALPKELVKDITAEAFKRGAAGLPPRINHELSRITKGVLS